MTIGPGTRSDLFNIARSIAKALANPEKFCEDIGHYQERTGTKLFEEKVLGTIRSLPPLLAIDNDTVNWKFDFWGRGLDTRASVQFLQGGELERTRGLIDRFALHLKELGLDDVTPETLAHRFHILPSQPTWTKVQEAIALAGDVTDPDDLPPTVAAAISDIREYAKQLRETLPTVAQALFCGWNLGTLALRDPFASDAHRRAPAEGLAVLRSRSCACATAAHSGLAISFARSPSGIVSLVGAFLPEAPEVLDPTASGYSQPGGRWSIASRGACKVGRGGPICVTSRSPNLVGGFRIERSSSGSRGRVTWARRGGAALCRGEGRAERLLFRRSGRASPREWGGAVARILSQSSATDRVPTWILVPALLAVGFRSALPAFRRARCFNVDRQSHRAPNRDAVGEPTAADRAARTLPPSADLLPRCHLGRSLERPALSSDAALLIAAADASALASDAVRAAFRFER